MRTVFRMSRRWPRLIRLGEADTSQEILKPSIGSERIEGRPQQDGRVEAYLIGLFQPDHRLVQIAEPYIDQGNIGVGGRVSILFVLQILNHFQRFFPLSRSGVSISEIG